MGVAVPIGLTLLSAGASAYGKHQEGQAAARAAMQNRQMAFRAAADARERGQQRAGEYRRAGSRLASQQQALAAAVGADTGLSDSTLVLSEMDALQASNNAAREAWGLDTQASLLLEQARGARAAGNVEAASSLLGGFVGAAGHGYGAYQDWRQGNLQTMDGGIDKIRRGY